MGALEGIRVVDLGVHLSGPYASTLLADMGAEVIRIERPGGDDDRRIGAWGPNEDSNIFISRARNKKSMTLNLRSSEGQQILRCLIKISDVLLENYGPSVRNRLHLDYENLRQVNPRMIMASISGYGSWGPKKDKVAFDAIAQAACGSMYLTGFRGDARPTRAAVGWVDYASGLHAAVGILLALWHRERTGKGQHVDVSLYDSAVNLVIMQGSFADYIVYGHERPRIGNASAYAYADTFQAKDGWIFIHLGRDALWRRFIKAIGREELLNDTRFSSDTKRVENRKLIDDIVKPWVAEKTCQEVASKLDKIRVPNQKVCNITEAVNEPQLSARDMLFYMDYPDKGKIPIPGIVIKLSDTPGEIRTRAPFLGEHNEEILGGLLGYKEKEIDRLKQKGVI